MDKPSYLVEDEVVHATIVAWNRSEIDARRVFDVSGPPLGCEFSWWLTDNAGVEIDRAPAEPIACLTDPPDMPLPSGSFFSGSSTFRSRISRLAAIACTRSSRSGGGTLCFAVLGSWGPNSAPRIAHTYVERRATGIPGAHIDVRLE